MIKVKLNVNQENYQEYREKLESAGFEISDDAKLVLYEENYSMKTISGKKEDSYYFIDVNDIVYFQSYGHDIFAKTKDDEEYKIKENLTRLELYLDENTFIRISGSIIINIKCIKKVTPQLGLKFRVLLTNGEKVFVNRNYYYRFVEKFNI